MDRAAFEKSRRTPANLDPANRWWFESRLGWHLDAASRNESINRSPSLQLELWVGDEGD